MKRLWMWLTERPYGCGCGKSFRNSAAFSRHVWGHEGFNLSRDGMLTAKKDFDA